MATYYWIGGNGNWNDTAKWSLTSGGTTAGVVPGAADDVIFNAASDGAANANFTVTANAAGCAANSITVTPDRVITFDGGAGNLSANFWTQNASASTTGAILNNTISINSNVTVNRGVFTANGNLTIGNNFFANGFGTPATANRVVFTLANTMTTGTFTANASNWFWQNFNFSANSRLYLTGSNRAIFAMQSPNIAMTWGSNSAIIANAAGNSGETRTVYMQLMSGVLNSANATANLNPFSFNVTDGSDTVNFHTDSAFFGGVDFTGFSGTANLQSNLWVANGNLTLSPTMTFVSTNSARYVRIGGWTGSNTGLITNGLSNANISINFQGANINANMFVANNFDLLGNSVLLCNIGNINLGNNIISAAAMVCSGSNHGINFNTSGEIILTGNNQTIFTGSTSEVNAQNYQGNIKITSNYTGATGNRTFITNYSNLTIKVLGSNGIFIGNTATDNIRILSNASNTFGTNTGKARIDLRGMTNTLLNDRRTVRGGSYFPTADKMQAGSNVTGFTDGAIDSLGIVFPFPLQFGTGDTGCVYVYGNNIESTGNILFGGVFNGSVFITNVKIIGNAFSSNNTISTNTKNVWFDGSQAEILLTGSNTTIIDLSGNTTSLLVSNGGNAKLTSTYTGNVGTRTIILGTQTYSNTALSNLSSFGTLGFGNVVRGIDLNTTATDTVLANGHIFDLDLTGMNCSWNQGAMNVYGNFTVASSGGNILPSANVLNVIGANNAATTTIVNATITGTAGQFSCNNQLLAENMAVVVTGTLTGTGTISGYSSPKTYYIIATNGRSAFTLSDTLGGSPITTTAGTTTGLTFTINPNFRGIYGNDRELNFDMSGPNTSGVTTQRVIIYSNLVLANNRTYTQVEGNLTIGNNVTLTTGIFRTLACSSPVLGVLQFNANSSMNITGSNTTVWNSNRLSVVSITGTPNVYFSYNGSVGNRLLDFGSTALVSGDTNTLVNLFNFGTNTSSQFYFNPSANDTLVFVANSNINDLNMSQWTGNLSLGNTGTMYVRGNISLPVTGTVVNTGNLNWAIVANSLSRTLNFNNTILNANIILNAFSSSVGGNYIFSDNATLPIDKGITWSFGNLEFSEGINVVARFFNNGSTTTPQRHWKTGNANITCRGNSTTIVNIGNLQSITGDIKILCNSATSTGTRSFFGGTATQGNLTPTYDVVIGNDFISNAIVISPAGDTLNFGGRFANVDLSNLSATQNCVLTTAGYQVYGNYTLPVSNGVFTAGTGTLTFQGQNTTQYLNFNNRTWEVPVTFNGANSTFIMNSNFTMGAANAAKIMNMSNGTLDLNGYQITIGTFLTGTGTKSILWNNGKIAVSNSSATAWNANVPANFTTQVGTGAGRISLFGTAAKTFVGGNINYNATLDLAGASNLTITGNNTFKDIVMTYSAANNFILFPAAGTTTVETFTGTGTSNTNILGLRSATAGNRSTIALSGGGNVNVNFANIRDINFTPMPTNGTSPMVWYVGANSLNLGNVSGALFTNGGANAPIVYAIESGSAWTVPNDWNSSNNVVYLYGAGGGGGGGRIVTDQIKAAGGGGGGGGFTTVTNFSASAGSTIAYEVGLGGTGGAANANGSAGGNTVWATVYTANGGGGGGSTTTPTSVPGIGGTGTQSNGGNGGFGAIVNNQTQIGAGGGGGGGAAGPNGTGGAGGSGFATSGTSAAGGGGGGSGGGSNGANAASAAGGIGGNNSRGFGGGAASTQGYDGGGGGGGRNANVGGKGGGGTDILNSIGGGGGAGATVATTGSNNDLIRNYGGGGAGGGINNGVPPTNYAGGSGANGVILIVYYSCTAPPIFDSTSTMFMLF